MRSVTIFAVFLLLAAWLPLRADTVHVVKRGESLGTIAQRYGVSVDAVARANHLHDEDLVRIGQKLVIPGQSSSTTYTVVKGDSLSSIAHDHGVSLSALAAINHLKDQDLLTVGQKLALPASSSAIVKYTVARGDSLASIAAKFNISVSDILRDNTLAHPDSITPGQELLIPPAPAGPYPQLPPDVAAALGAIRVRRDMWRYIVIHHSGTPMGSGTGMDRYHRVERHMVNGLAYHFVIGNGRGMKDGEIYIGNRWKRQIEGGHLSVHALNLVSIGICLVGDLEDKPPTAAQMDSLEALVRYLLTVTGLPVSAVTTHRLIQPHHTLCPGKYFPYDQFIATLKH